jgi:hypothetical protein
MTRIPGQLRTATLLPAFFFIVGMALLCDWLTAVSHGPGGEESVKRVSEINRYGLAVFCILSLAFPIWLCRKGIPRKGLNRFLGIGRIAMWFIFSCGTLCLIFYLS